MTVLEFRDVSLDTRQGVRLLEGVSLTVGRGLTALVGRNGAGKSTLLNAVFALHPLATGTIALDHADSLRDRRAFRKKAVFQTQNFSAYPEMTGSEFLTYCARLRGAARKAAHASAEEWLARVGLWENRAQGTGRYSQGMLQRLGIAYAMQANAALCVLDEPFAGVDTVGRAELSDLLAEEACERIVLVCTHHVEDMTERGAALMRIEDGSARIVRP